MHQFYYTCEQFSCACRQRNAKIIMPDTNTVMFCFRASLCTLFCFYDENLPWFNKAIVTIRNLFIIVWILSPTYFAYLQKIELLIVLWFVCLSPRVRPPLVSHRAYLKTAYTAQYHHFKTDNHRMKSLQHTYVVT